MTNLPNASTIGLLALAMGIAAPAATATESDTDLTRAERAILGEQPEQDAPTEEQLATDDSFWSGWEGSVEAGLTGASGNNERFNIRASIEGKRETDLHLDKVSFTYSYAEDDAEQTENRFEAKYRHDWKLPDSKWRIYARASYEYDEFQDWDHRVTIGPGVGYEAIDNEKTQLLLRAGVQATKEIGGEENKWTPEGVLGFDYAHQLTERQSIEASFDFYPALDDFGPYRFEGEAAWKIEVDPESNLFLRVGLEDRYDSSPGPDKKRNDITYFATLGWSF